MYSTSEIDNLNIDNSDFINILSELNINDNINNNKKRKIDDCNDKITLNDNSAIIYARCSSKKQDNEYHQSLLCQVSKCLDYCSNMKLDVKFIIKDIKSAHELNKLLVFNILNQYENCNIIIMDPSRLSRSVSQANDFIIKCLENKIKIHFVNDKLVSDSNYDYCKIIKSVAEAYTETQTLSKRLKTCFEVKRKLGSHFGKASFGYDIEYINDSNTGINIRKLILNHTEQDIITIIKYLYYGIDINTFNSLFQKVINDKKFKLKYNNGEIIKEIEYGNFSSSEISNFLNEYDIKNRNNLWTPNSILKIINFQN